MKNVIVTFKVEKRIAAHLATMTNKSQFIREALLKSMNHICPLCKGEGMIPHDEHIKEFLNHHQIDSCCTCSGPVVTCV